MTRWRGILLAGLVCVLTCRALAYAQVPATPLLRLFLADGTSLTSFGEWVRMGDRVVFSLPLGEGPTPDLQLVTLAASRVDWATIDECGLPRASVKLLKKKLRKKPQASKPLSRKPIFTCHVTT